MIILDTNVISALMRQGADPVVVGWLDSQPSESIWTTAVTVFEVHFGLELLARGRRRRQLEDEFARALDEDFEGRILPFEQSAARAAASIAARRRQEGRSIEIRDALIAGIASTRRATLATRNTRHFADLGIALMDPWAAT
ncbi:MAG: type II toxin-antitoxin system VapC family toxin [Geminicoccaceae bacterium]